MGKFFFAAIPLWLLAGCAGTHVRPDASYAKLEPSVTARFAFDQQGWIYPLDESQVPWATVQLSRFGEAVGLYSFRLDRLQDAEGHTPYTEVERARREREATAHLNSRLADGDTILILVHGFNENYADARAHYGEFISALAPLPPTTKVVEVFWDGLEGSDADPLGAVRISFWRKALLNSNLAGQVGLRPILNGIDKSVNVRFLTFSRGAAVSLSAVVDPEYDDGLAPRPRPAPLENAKLQSIKIGAIAAAVGDGHVNDKADSLLTRQVDVVSGIHTKDFATSKLFFPADFWGDTRLGSTPAYVADRMSRPWSKLRLQGVSFQSPKAHHNLGRYLDNRDAAECFFQLLDLKPGACAPAVLVRPASVPQ
ncbi:conserved exported hypothetical protein [Cupriavidus taiwanensis]|uniref:Lipoprotein n=1 Tax=Cupriavidus taiwanensis TaxID=164546 RepID=A0A375CBQ8_9BURK|nr:hypothetical protein [Cupriavidus taiwanensis]SOY67323.1 conserved exported hypothetical protein [Cupriavidus taiwanensis]